MYVQQKDISWLMAAHLVEQKHHDFVAAVDAVVPPPPPFLLEKSSEHVVGQGSSSLLVGKNDECFYVADPKNFLETAQHTDVAGNEDEHSNTARSSDGDEQVVYDK
jgi:hypothetical protein